MKTLSQFIDEEKKTLKRFEEWWLEQRKKNPESFPLEFEDGNEGGWFDQLMAFEETE